MALTVNATLTNQVEKHLGARPVPPPYLSSRVIDDGPGWRYLQKHCATSSYLICQYGAQFSNRIRDGDAMMWARLKQNGGVYFIEDVATRKRLRDESLGFVRDSILSDIPGQIRASAWNLAKLLLAFRVDAYGSEFTHTAETYRSDIGWVGGTELTNLFPNIDECNKRPNEPCGALRLSYLRIPHYLSTLLALVFLAWQFSKRLRPSQWATEHIFILICLGGLVANASVCGILAGPYDRYQLRVIWLVPALAAAMILAKSDARAAAKSASGG